MSEINLNDVKIKFKGVELTEFSGDKVLCFGCNRQVELSESEFCLYGDLQCHFCHRCLKIVANAKKEGRTATKQELMEAV